MKPKHIKRARGFVGKRWYLWMRALKHRKLFAVWDKFVTTCDNRDVPIACLEIERHAKKEAYYAKKLNNGQKNER